jgi:hypothetical protein
MGHWSSGKYSTDYEDDDGKEVNQLTPSLEREEYPFLVEEPVKDDRDPVDDDDNEEAPPATEEEDEEAKEEEEEEEKEAPEEEWTTSPRPFHQGLPPYHATRCASSTLHPPTRSWRTRMTPRRSRTMWRAATTATAGSATSISRC